MIIRLLKLWLIYFYFCWFLWKIFIKRNVVKYEWIQGQYLHGNKTVKQWQKIMRIVLLDMHYAKLLRFILSKFFKLQFCWGVYIYSLHFLYSLDKSYKIKGTNKKARRMDVEATDKTRKNCGLFFFFPKLKRQCSKWWRYPELDGDPTGKSQKSKWIILLLLFLAILHFILIHEVSI